MKVAVVSSLFGGYDEPIAPVPQTIDCEYVLIADREYDCWPWKTIVEPRPHLVPRLAAKVAKCRPDVYTDATVSVWVDAHIRLTHPGMVAWAVGALGRANLAQLRHPQRQRLTEEAELSATLPKYAGMDLRAQVGSYLARGYPDDWGLWAAGIIVRRHSPKVAAFGDAWLAEQVRWTVQDQLSEPPLLYWSGLEMATLPGPLIGHWGFDLGVHVDGTR
jgi:TOD1/MUCI70, glycosyltransferase-like domain